MACPHGRSSTPSTCSQCIGALASRVTLGPRGVVLVNGSTARLDAKAKLRASTRYTTREDVARRRRELLERERTSTIDSVRDLDDDSDA